MTQCTECGEVCETRESRAAHYGKTRHIDSREAIKVDQVSIAQWDLYTLPEHSFIGSILSRRVPIFSPSTSAELTPSHLRAVAALVEEYTR